MTTIQSSQSGSAYSNALAKLLERMQSANDSQSGSTSTTTGTGTTTTPSLASVLAADDDTSSTSTQTSSAITALMMDIQQMKSASSSGTTSAGSAMGQPPSLSDMFAETDTDSDGSLSLSEFMSTKPDGMSDDDAKSMFNAIDSNGTGSITQDQLSAYMEKNKPAQGPDQGGGPPDASEMFSKIDGDSSGSVSLSEFVAVRPKGMSEEDANTLFKSIDTEGTGSISEKQFADKLSEQAGAAGASSTDGSSSQTEIEALAKDIMKQLTAVIQSFNNGYVDSSAYTASAETSAID